MKPSNTTTVPVEVFRGEIVQLWNAGHTAFRIQLSGEPRPRFAFVHSGKLTSSPAFPAEPGNSVQEVLDAWLADMPFSTAEAAASAFGLDKHMHIALQEASEDILFRLQALKAILEGASVITFGACRGVANPAEIILAASQYAEYSQAGAGNLPAFVVLHEGGSTGTAMAADRILKIKQGGVKAMLVDY